MQKHSMWAVVAGVACIVAGLIGAMRPADSPAAPPQPAGTTFVVKDVRLFDGERVTERTSVVVRDGLVAAIGAEPGGLPVIDGEGRTLLPGLIDAHTHAFGDALARALVFGVTTELDMFTSHQAAAQWRAVQATADGAPARADIFSAGTLATAPRGHGTEYGMQIPTITGPGEAESFVDARLAEGSDYIKIIFEDGAGFGMQFPSISRETLRALVSAAKARARLAVVHIGSQRGADQAIAAGASGLAHIFSDEPPAPDFAARVAASGAFVIPTLTVNESAAGVPTGATLLESPVLAPFFTAEERLALRGSFPARAGSTQSLQHALDTTRLLHEAGVPVLAGTDAPNPGTAHGASLHRELELLVRAGLTPTDALRAATAAPAAAFHLTDRGRVAPGMRADLLLVTGDPTRDITATRRIEAVWKRGARLDRRHAPADDKPAAAATTSGVVSLFDDGGTEPAAAFGAGWQVSTDTMMGGRSEARMALTRPGADGTPGALEVTGTVVAGAPFPWAGAMFFPAATPMTPADVSAFREIVFWARGDGRDYHVMVFATRLGTIPSTQPFAAGPEWKEYVMPLEAFATDGSDLRGVLFSASPGPGPFRVVIDNVRLR